MNLFSQPTAMWHYHAVLECGHAQSFDLPQNLFLEVLETDAEAEVSVEIPCATCNGQTQRSESLKVMPGKGPCALCS